jgi:hypothetical protein
MWNTPKCRKHRLRTHKCHTCKGSGDRPSIFGTTRCTTCSGKGFLCPKCGKHWN